MGGKFKSNLNFKIIIRSFIIVFIVFSLSSIFVYRQTAKKFHSNVTKEIRLESQLVNKDISDIFEKNKIILNTIEANEDIRIYLKEVTTRKDITTNILYKKIIKTFNNIIELNDGIDNIWIANEQANFYLDAHNNIDYKNYDIYKRPWRDLAANSTDVILTDTYTEYSNSKQVVSIVKAFREDSNIIGYMGININLEKIPKIMKNYIVGKKGMNFLINKNKEYIYSYVGDSQYDIDFKNELIDSISSIDNNCQEYKKIIYMNDTYYIYYKEIVLNNWGIIQLISEKDIDQDIREFLKIILIVFSIAATLLLLTIIFEGVSYKFNENKLKVQARTDSLTGSNNRSYFMELAVNEFNLAKKQNRQFNVLMLDIDYFKSVNDNYGHRIGDMVLENMARLSVKSLGKNAIFGRIGGEEFAAIIMDIGEMEAFIAAEDLRTKISEMDIDTHKGRISINVSIGLTSMKKNDLHLKDIIERADEAMYEAKKSGRNKVKIK
ncbi:hypothetical protein SH1V18_22730 [Vallitalea longa]|uniref:GGDEF domain-containing protein n=1 Tax=Vallitalea longa TaxID=2936439 RepID=A0A9W6DFU6_9FIRM|nr:sensor domain-containing diguanylate cyclase [Vallitalea longa]GKX29793.1 hypothetical protein SH1V18_22730 [Vallitalea longa]